MIRAVVALAGLALMAGCAQRPSEPPEREPEPEPVRESSTCARLAAVGDIMLSGSAEPYMKDGYSHAFAATRNLLQSADITIGNLETALTTADNDWIDKQFRFRDHPRLALALRKAGFDLVSLANNHSMDYGPRGLFDTRAALQATGVEPHGADENLAAARKPAMVSLDNGLTLAFLAYSNTFPREFWATDEKPGTAFGKREDIEQDVRRAAQRADFVVVSFHWGREKMRRLREYQPMLAHAAIDSGASLVLGHHPHILQGIERYNNGLVLYSLGNFAFGSFSPHAQHSVLAQLSLCRNRAVEFALVPLNVNNFEVYFQPRPVFGLPAETILAELQALSFPLGTTLELRDGRILEQSSSRSRSRGPVSGGRKMPGKAE